MGPEMTLDNIFLLFQIVVLSIMLAVSYSLLRRGRGSLRLVFFAFAVACYLLSDVYWLVYELLRPELRMPFAANEFCEWAMFLLLGAALNAGVPVSRSSARREMLGAALFAAANTALWIAWSGEWMQDILTGLSLGWFLCCLAAHIKREGTFTTLHWRVAGLVCTVLIAAQAATFFVPEAAKAALDLFCYVLLFAGAAYLLLRAVLTLNKSVSVSPGFAALAWMTVTMYMSAGVWYLAAVLLSILCFPLMLLALRKEAAA